MTGRWSLLLIAAALLAASACADDQRVAGASARTLVFSYAETEKSRHDLLVSLARDFEAEHAGARVYMHRLPHSTDDQRTFYLTSLASRSRFVDVFKADVIWTAEFAAAGLLRDLSSSEALADRSWYQPALLRQATYDGKQYAVPMSLSVGTLFYRLDLLRKHGLRPPRTLKELEQHARKVGQAEGMDGLHFPAEDYEGLACVFFELYACLGDPVSAVGGKVSLHPGVTRATLEFMHRAVHEVGITPASVLSQTEVESEEAFASGRAVFVRGWHRALPALVRRLGKDAVGVSAMPASRGPLSGGYLLAINRHTDVPRLAEAFVAFLSRPENRQRLAVPGAAQPAADEAGGVGGVPAPRIIRPMSPNYFELSQAITSEARAVLQGEATPAAAADRLVKRVGALKLPRRAGPEFPAASYMTRYRQ